ncbi:hypothetical protein GCM10023213_14020 [Prosthecobacter algae]|uniref:Minor tail protein Z (GPZ) n=1 Tax=Prosthecobacter algae TaxID=1144682 RepID=A0ABP9NZB9_9BACT
MIMRVGVTISDEATPTLKDLQNTLNDAGKLQLRKAIAARLETLLRSHVVAASKTRHKTATRLGANPSNYLAKRADTVESQVTGNADGLIRLTIYGDIFARVDGPVNVRPKRAKSLAIPAIAGAYGRRPREIGGLRLVVFLDAKKAALAKVTGDGGTGTVFLRKQIVGPPRPGTDRWRRYNRKFGPEKPTPKVTVWYWLKKGVTLPQDRGLLPQPEEIAAATEAGAVDFLEAQIAKRSSNGFLPPKA